MTAIFKARMANLVARYDGQTLSVEPPEPLPRSGPLTAVQQAAWQHLQAWCASGAGDDLSPLWRPLQRPALAQPVSVAVLRGALGAQLAEAFSRQLDGSDQLAGAGGRWAGRWLRLCVKLQDAQWWRARQPSDPWDAGYLLSTPAARMALQRFVPRRATLLVASGWQPDALLEAVVTLQARCAVFLHPVRVLVVSPGAGPAPGQPERSYPMPWRAAARLVAEAAVIDGG